MSTTRKVAERVVLDTFKNDPSWTNAELINAIDKALQAEKERAAGIVEAGAMLVSPVGVIPEGDPVPKSSTGIQMKTLRRIQNTRCARKVGNYDHDY